MRVDILSLFPDAFAPLHESIVKRAVMKGKVELNIVNIRDFTHDKHNTADDTPYGGGAGMLMKPEPIYEAVQSVIGEGARVIFPCAWGRPYTQQMARELAESEQLIIVCGHYEGVDERVIEELHGEPVCLGDYVLTGGEIPAMAIADSVIRLLPGVLGDDASSEEESFSGQLLEYPQYTRPPEFMGREVPSVLQSGDHKRIAAWRREQSVLRTYRYRPELLEQAALSQEDKAQLAALEAERVKTFHAYVALVHFPVYDKKKHIINTSITNLDVHDIARAAHSYGLEGYYIVQPIAGQQALFNDLLSYWREGKGAVYNSDRREALSAVSIVDSIEQAMLAIKEQTGELPKLIATSASAAGEIKDYRSMRGIIEQGGSYLLLLGTGWGLCEEVMSRCDYTLRPIYGRGEYNHLSVRSAASIIFDRLFGEKTAHS